MDEACTTAVLIDFGIASELAREAIEASLPESLEGTLAYISPEQTGRSARRLDSRTDLYSLGVTLFEMLLGRLPFLEKDALALVYAHLAKAPPMLESLLSGFPSALARIAERCLEKVPEKRYQTARGLAADLERCLLGLQKGGQIELFPLGQKDYSPKLQIPESLVSREAESQVIAAAFQGAARGNVELLLLGGPSGVGKTALVRAVYRDIAKVGRGLLLSGKHDQLGRTIPYAALSQAVSGLMRSLAASPKALFDTWRNRIEQKLGPLARVIADFVPELEWLLGPIPALPIVPTEMSYNRLKLAWIDFIRAVTEASPPLVLFLDDLQWIDPASLELLKTLLSDVGRQHLLLIAAYRDNEVEPHHPLWGLIDAVEQSGVAMTRLHLGPLEKSAVQTWLAITLSAEAAHVAPLSQVLWSKTQGNPFFLEQLLLALYRKKRVKRNLESGAWEWDQDGVAAAAVTDNVVELMRSQVGDLPARTQSLLGQAACAGHSFDFGELAILSELALAQVAEELQPALLRGLVIPIDGQYREAQALAQSQSRRELHASYRFSHDRVQEAFYERIAPEQRARTHLQIGRRLQAVFAREGGSSQKLLELTRHLNLGAAALDGESERCALARLNLQAAKAAKVNASYRLQATLVEQAMALLGKRAWEEERELSIELTLEQMEADYMLREFDAVHKRAAVLLALPLPAVPCLAAQELRVRTCLASGQYGEGERLGRIALEEQGIHYPDSIEACFGEALQGIKACDIWLDANPEGFRSMAADFSPELLLCDALQNAMLACAGMGGRPALAVLGLVRNVQRTIERATLTPSVPLFVGSIASCRSAFLGDYRGSVRWTQEGVEAAQRLSSPFFPECSALRATFGSYEHPVEQNRKYCQAALQVARASGSFQGTSSVLSTELCFIDLWAGRPLEYVAAREASLRDLMQRAGDAAGKSILASIAGYLDFLRNPKNFRPSAEAEWLTPNSRSFLAIGDGALAEASRIQEAHLFLAFGESARALERAEEAERFRPAAFGTPVVTDIPLWRGLAAAKCCVATLSNEQRQSLLATLDHAIERVRCFADGCVENFLHKLHLLEAEHARLRNKNDEAMAKYDEAIALARKERFLHIEALAAHFCAEFYLQAGRERVAGLYLQDARDAYTRWNALALVSFLEQTYPILRAPAKEHPTEQTTTESYSSTTRTTGDIAIDLDTTIRAAQALTHELDAQRVVAELMQLLRENAGAQGAALILISAEEQTVAALLSNSQVRTGLAEPYSSMHPIAQSVIQYVLRSREPLVLGDVPSDNRFAEDPHLLAAAIRSVIAVPLLHQGRLGGILYLEHQNASAFPAARIRLLAVLASQSAVALENARLYADLQAANIGLEARVAERTAALDKALKELWSEMDLAQKIQTVLLPQKPEIPGYDLAAVMRPAEQVGGDYYDVFRRGTQDWVLIGDVSGHGVPAGLCMMMIQTALRAVALTLERTQAPLTPRHLLGLVNDAVDNNLKQIGRGHYMTITALCIEGATVRYAGLHQDLLIYRAASQQVERVETQGVWLGVLDGDITELLADNTLRLEANDVLLLFTDGYTEARVEGRLLESKGLVKLFEESCAKAQTSAALIVALLSSLRQAVISDDVTLVVLRRLGAPAKAA